MTGSSAMHWHLDDSYRQLPDAFYADVAPTPVAAPALVVCNAPLARDLGLDPDALCTAEGTQLLAGNRLPDGARPLAQAYCGHQFGHFTRLGDGRAVLLGEQITPDGQRFDIQLKGAGRTPYSRNGDGRAALGPMLREYLVSEAMAGLGIPTTRSLAVVATGEHVRRDRALPGAVLVRVAASHLRVGTFEFAATEGPDAVRALADYAIARHDPELCEQAPDVRYRHFLAAVIARQARLVAQWMLAGFVHGVMNTDNVSIAGETIDYGPCAFIDRYRPSAVFSSIDQRGRYAYRNQPAVAKWNLYRFAEALLPLLDDDADASIAAAEDQLRTFDDHYRDAWTAGLCAKLGLSAQNAADRQLADDWIALLAQTGSDWTLSFRRLAVAQAAPDADWLARWQASIARQPDGKAAATARMLAANPAVIARNHQVERALAAAASGDLGPLHALATALRQPFDAALDGTEFAKPPAEDAGPYVTYCGT